MSRPAQGPIALLRDLWPARRRAAASGSPCRRGCRTLALQQLEPRLALSGTTQRLADFPDGVGVNGDAFVTAGGVTYFAAHDPAHGSELWRTDGRTVSLVSDIVPGPAGSGPAGLIAVGSTVFFTAADSDGSHGLWKSDGTAATTVRVGPQQTLFSAADDPKRAVLGGELFFAGQFGDGSELWKTDGTTTTQISNINANFGSYPYQMAAAGGLLFFAASDYAATGFELWKTDGTTVTQVADIRPGSQSSHPSNFQAVGSTVYFTADDGTHGHELWKTDGTTTSLVSDIRSGGPSSDPQDLTPLGGDLYFSAVDDAGQRRLWKTDGGAAVQVGSTSDLSGVSHLAAIGGQLYFSARDGLNGQEVWRTDGTTTTRLTDINAGPGDASPSGFTAYAGEVFFSADDGSTGRELWRFDGTTATRVADILAGSQSSAPAALTVVGDRLVFAAHDGLRRNPWFFTTKSAPTAVGLTNSSVVENAPAGTPVATILTTDPDVGETTFTYSLVDGGDFGGDLGFGIVGNTLVTTRPLDRESLPVRTIRIRSTDPEGFFAEQSFEITVGNVNEAPNAVSTARRLADIQPGTASSFEGWTEFARLGGFTFFAANDGVHGKELWKTDGVTTSLVADLLPGLAGSDPLSLHAIGGRIVFAAASSSDGPVRLWQTDGTVVTQIPNVTIGYYGFRGVELGGLLYFDADAPGGSGARTLWRTDGTTATVVANLQQVTGLDYAVAGDAVYFAADDGVHGFELWRTNGISTTLVADLNPGPAGSAPESFAVLGETVFFRAATTEHGYELWQTNGSGATLVRDINPGPAGSRLGGLTACDWFVYFAADDGASGIELWRTNGTTTELFADINAGGADSIPNNLTVARSTLYFSADDGTHGKELWKTDGQVTALVADINVGPGESQWVATEIVAFGSDLYFSATDASTQTELWKTDGTTTVRVTDSGVYGSEFGLGSSFPSNLKVIGDTLYFSAIDDAGGREPWVLSAGVAENSPAGTAVATLVTFDPDAGNTINYLLVPGEGADDNGDFIIQSGILRTTRPLDYELGRTRSVRILGIDQGGLSTETVITIWLTDVNEQPVIVTAPRLLRDIRAVGPSFPAEFTDAGPFVYFTANDDAHGRELWRTDGVTTALVADLRPGPNGSSPNSLTTLGSTLFFAASTDGGQSRIWKTDGTTTSPAGNLRGGGPYGSFESIALNGWLYLSASESDGDLELWKTDGSTTVRVANINEEPSAGSSISGFRQAGNTLYFTADDGVHGRELWKTTGSGATLVDDIRPGPGSSSPTFAAAAVGDTLFFMANTDAYGYELWKTTGSGATLVRDIRPGPTGCRPGDMVAVSGFVYFTADDGVSGSELWRSDGTEVGTTRVTDIWPGVLDASPQDLTVVGDTLFFTADDGVHGRELWKFDGAQAVRTSDINVGPGSSYPGSLVDRGGSLVFLASDGGDELQHVWMYDGVSVIRVSDRIGAYGLTASQDWLVLQGSDLITSAEPWAISPLLPVAENQSVGTVVAAFSTADPDLGDSFTYEIVPIPDSTGFTMFTIQGNTLRTAGPLNHEGESSYAIAIRATDSGGLSTTSFFTVVVTDVNEAPISIWTPPLNVAENSAADTPVGGLNTLDPEVGDQFTYALVSGEGATDNGRFTITAGGQIRVAANAALNFERQSSLSIRVRVTDQGGLSLETPLTVRVTDVDEEPVIDHIVPPANGSYRAGQPLRFTAVTTQPVTRVGRGVADIGLVVGRAAQKATLVGGLGTNRLTFQYVPTRGVNDADGVTLGSTIRMPKGAFLRDAQGRRFSLAMPAVATGGVLVDTAAPLIRSLGRPAAGTYRPGQELLFTAVMSERVTVTGTPAITFTFGAARRQATYVSGSGTTALTFRYVVRAGDVAAKGITIVPRLAMAGAAITDAAGNPIIPTFRAPSGRTVVLAPALAPASSSAMLAAFAGLG